MSGTRKLGRPSDHRMAMLRGMVTYLLENGQIETTVFEAAVQKIFCDTSFFLVQSDEPNEFFLGISTK